MSTVTRNVKVKEVLSIPNKAKTGFVYRIFANTRVPKRQRTDVKVDNTTVSFAKFAKATKDVTKIADIKAYENEYTNNVKRPRKNNQSFLVTRIYDRRPNAAWTNRAIYISILSDIRFGEHANTISFTAPKGFPLVSKPGLLGEDRNYFIRDKNYAYIPGQDRFVYVPSNVLTMYSILSLVKEEMVMSPIALVRDLASNFSITINSKNRDDVK